MRLYSLNIYDKSVNDDIFQKMILVLKYLFYILSFEFARGLLQHNDGVVHQVAVKPGVMRPVSP